MGSELLRGAFRIAVLVVLLALVTLPFQPRDSAEFVVTVLALGVGVAFMLAVAALARHAGGEPPRDKRSVGRYNQRNPARGKDQ